MLLKIVLVALVFAAVHGQDIDKPEDRVANKPIVRARRGAAEELIEPLNLVARPLGPTNGRQRRDSEPVDKRIVELEDELDKLIEELKKLQRARS